MGACDFCQTLLISSILKEISLAIAIIAGLRNLNVIVMDINKYL